MRNPAPDKMKERSHYLHETTGAVRNRPGSTEVVGRQRLAWTSGAFGGERGKIKLLEK